MERNVGLVRYGIYHLEISVIMCGTYNAEIV